MVVLAVAAAGGVGCAFTGTEVGAEIQVLSAVLLTRIMCETGCYSCKCYRSLICSTINIVFVCPSGAVTTIVPVATAHVGCMVVLAVAAAGGEGCAFTGTEVGAEIQVLSAVLLTKIMCEDPADTPANVTEACHAPPSILYSYAPSGAVTTIVPVARAHVG